MGGGWKRGAINEIWGPPGSGKTILAKQTLQRRHIMDRKALWVDLGVTQNLSPDPSLIVARPFNAEGAFETVTVAAELGTQIAIVDDTTHLVRQIELDDPEYKPDEHREFKLELEDLLSGKDAKKGK